MADEDEVAEARAALEEALRSLEEKMAKIDDSLFELFEDWDRSIDEAANKDQRKSVLDRMSELLSHRSYIHNLVRDINEEL
jgi:flagellar hook-associated protein FlgK